MDKEKQAMFVATLS